ncbi:uncharacterized protein [Asterias amurensis]|uniref:uncharacterized protein n=1 Tax=Asterias amurensis TaxID=7602 RepID=UPI003AB54E72
MAEKRKISAAGSGAKRIKALFSSFIRKDPVSPDKENSTVSLDSERIEPAEEATVPDISSPQSSNDTTDGVVPCKQETPQRCSVRPLDAEAFFDRVETFTVSGWFAKPKDLSPLYCARYGWENSDKDFLKCVSCKEILYGGLPGVWETESYSLSYSKLKESLRSSHSKICPWPDSPSPESFQSIPLDDIKSSIKEFYSRVDSLHPLGDRIPDIDCSPLQDDEEFDVDHVKKVLLQTISERGDTAVIISEEEKPVWQAVCLLALFGWRKCLSEQTGCPVLVCEYCRRHAGLWNFASFKDATQQSRSVTESSSQDSTGESQNKRIKEIQQSSFNLALEHRSWCPWIQPSPFQPMKIQRISNEPMREEEKPKAELMWQQLLFIMLKKNSPDTYGALKPAINKETTPPSQTWKAVRRILNVWQSKETTDASKQDTKSS